MAREKHSSSAAGKNSRFHLTGRIQREQPECQPGDIQLAAYVVDRVGNPLGTALLDQKGNYDVAVALNKPAAVDLLIGPADQLEAIRQSSAYRQHFAAENWKSEGNQFRLQHDAVLALDIWRPWWPLRICISGHVRKISHQDGETRVCPVPYVKVEIFDVDREFCWWPWLRRWWDVLLDRPLVRIPELLKERPFPPRPFPGPDPVPDLLPDIGPLGPSGPGPRIAELQQRVAGLPATAQLANAMPAPTATRATSTTFQPPAFTRVGEARLMDSSIAARLDRLTLTSRLAPWHLFPRCFYSTAEICETFTDCNGYFNCCFNWWPFHFRRGRLRVDQRPDIIVKLTQVINGVSTVIYLDPYTSTRWNVNNTHLDLFLDNEEVVCGNGDCQDRPDGSPVFLTRVGDDEIYKINQISGLYNETPLSNVAYGHQLLIYGQFGEGLSSGVPARYFRLSYAKQGSSEFTPITTSLEDTRVDKNTLFSESHTLGPWTINSIPALYEVRNFSDYYWYNPDWIGIWNSHVTEENTGTYILRLEVFDENGAKLTTAMGVDYRDGTVAPPAVLPPMTDRCDLVITLDNQRPDIELTIPAVLNDCGVIPWTPALSLDFHVAVSQANNRLRSWELYYTKGVDPTKHNLPGGSGISNTGLPGSVNTSVSGAALLTGLTTTCAFALKLYAYPHIRNGRTFIYYREQMKAIAIEKCPPVRHRYRCANPESQAGWNGPYTVLWACGMAEADTPTY